MICFPSFFPRVLVCDSNKGSSPFVRIFDFIHLFHKLVFTFCLLLCSLVFYFFKTGVFNFFCGRFLCHFFHFTDFQSKPGKKNEKNINVDKMGIWSVNVGILPAKGSNHDIFRDSDLTNWVLD
jgi:hypothetical protein